MNSWSRSREVEKPKGQQSVGCQNNQQDAAMDRADRATVKYPTCELEGASLHIAKVGSDWEVWLNCEDSTFTGLCVSAGKSRQDAVTDAVRILEEALDVLQGPA